MSATWYEIWADDKLYLLVVRPDENAMAGVVVIDPLQGNTVVHRADDYDSAKLWLLEDEYTLVRGRMTPD